MKAAHLRLLQKLLALPTAPLCEEHIAAFVRQWANRRQTVSLTTDRFGNMLLRCRRGTRTTRPLIFVAHMDHPGFEAVTMISQDRLKAIWRGGVTPDYFVGTGVRFYDGKRWTRGTIESIKTRKRHGRLRVESCTIRARGTVPTGALGMWDLPDPRVRGHHIHARACDDLAGMAAVLCAMSDLCRSHAHVNVGALFTRAEEVGFAGALCAARTGMVPRNAHVISIETSSEIPGVRMGDGPILRVGDASSVYAPKLTAACERIGQQLARRRAGFTFQRKLMDGGTSEATAFCDQGYEATGVCVALGNYHNMNRQRQRIASEYIDLRDLEALILWLRAIAIADHAPPADHPTLHQRLGELRKQWSTPLRTTVNRVHPPQP